MILRKEQEQVRKLRGPCLEKRSPDTHRERLYAAVPTAQTTLITNSDWQKSNFSIAIFICRGPGSDCIGQFSRVWEFENVTHIEQIENLSSGKLCEHKHRSNQRLEIVRCGCEQQRASRDQNGSLKVSHTKGLN